MIRESMIMPGRNELIYALCNAAFEGNLDEMRRLLSIDPSLAETPEGENRAIHDAANSGKAEAVTLLLDNGSRVNARDQDGMTPLHRACDSQELAAARVLIERGADVNAFDPKGYSPVALAIEGQMDEGFDIVQLLFAAGARRGLIDACLFGDLDRVTAIFGENPSALTNVPSHDMLICGTMHVGEYGRLEDRVPIVELLFAHGLHPDRALIEYQIKSVRDANLPMFIRALERYLESETEGPGAPAIS